MFCSTVSAADFEQVNTSFQNSIASMCVCVCVCVCVYVCVYLYSSACWLLPIARRLWHTWGVRISDLLLWVFLGASASSFMPVSKSIIFHLQRWKLQPTATGEKTIWYNTAREKMIYIDIGYKSAQRQKPTVAERY